MFFVYIYFLGNPKLSLIYTPSWPNVFKGISGVRKFVVITDPMAGPSPVFHP
jgi:hypothetical protein